MTQQVPTASQPAPRVSLLLDNLEEGGVQRALINLAYGFVKQGLEVDIVLQQAKGPFLHQIPKGAKVVDLNAPRLRTSVPAFVNYLRQKQPNAILASLHFSTEVAIVAKRLARSNARVVVCEQGALGPLEKVRPPLQRPLEFLGLSPGRPTRLVRLFYPWADEVVAVSRGAAEDLARVANLPLERVQVIYNPVITPDFVEKANETVEHPWFRDNEIPVILSVGRLIDQKDFPTLIRGFAQVQKVVPARLVILGTGPDRPKLEALIGQLGLGEHVALLGHTQNPFKYMSRASVFVLSSIWEGLGNVLIEAMAAGAPIVATDCRSGPSEVLDGGRYGWLTPVGDSQAIAEAILEVLSGQAKKVEPQWLDQFRLETVTQQYIEVLGLASSIPAVTAERIC